MANNKSSKLLNDGSNINLTDAKTYLTSFIRVQHNLKKAVETDHKLQGYNEAESYSKDLHKINVFVFDRQFIERYNDHNPPDKYVIVLGANKDFTATVLFAGCTIEDIGHNKVKLHVVRPDTDSNNPVSEHPPKKLAIDINKIKGNIEDTINEVFFIDNNQLTITIEK